MVDKRQLPVLGGALLTGLVFLSLWSVHKGPQHSPKRTASLSGPYRLLQPDNVTMEPFPYQVEALSVGDRETLIDIGNFTFTMNSPVGLCNRSAPLLVIALVHSAPKHFYHRNLIRNTWGKEFDVIFLLGETDNETQALLEDENNRYNDIVQGTFYDCYRNLTYKHVMGLKWMTYHCPSAKYVLKLDDDVFVHPRNFREFMLSRLSPLGARRLILCKVMVSTVAKRTYRSKWRVTPAEYSGRWYPAYCPGWSVIYSPDVVFSIYREAQRSPYFWIDDVHVTGTLVAQANITHTSLGALSDLWTDKKEIWDKHRGDFILGLTEPDKFDDLWQEVSYS